MYESWHTPSWDMEKSLEYYEGKKYKCEICGCMLDNHEVFLTGGKERCGCCK